MDPKAGQEITSLIRDTPKMLSLIYQDLAQPSVKKVGQALETVFEFGTSFLLPLKLRNEKVKLNFEKNMINYKNKLNDIPEEKLCDVNPQIGVPIIDRLTYITNEDIANLFTSLLTKASCTDTVGQAHPSFIQLLDRISVDEAKLIMYLKDKKTIPFIEIRAYTGLDYIIIEPRATLIKNEVQLTFHKNELFYLDNLIALGILTSEIDRSLTEPYFLYQAISAQNDFSYLKNEQTGISEIEEKKGVLRVTKYGEEFINAVT